MRGAVAAPGRTRGRETFVAVRPRGLGLAADEVDRVAAAALVASDRVRERSGEGVAPPWGWVDARSRAAVLGMAPDGAFPRGPWEGDESYFVAFPDGSWMVARDGGDGAQDDAHRVARGLGHRLMHFRAEQDRHGGRATVHAEDHPELARELALAVEEARAFADAFLIGSDALAEVAARAERMEPWLRVAWMAAALRVPRSALRRRADRVGLALPAEAEGEAEPRGGGATG